MARFEIRNLSRRAFTDLSHEAWRQYKLIGGEELFLTLPQWLHVSKSGHYVIDADEDVHFIPHGSIRRILWRPKKDAFHIVM